jgi:hypothetical protein
VSNPLSEPAAIKNDTDGVNLFGVYRYSDPNNGWGFEGWTTFVLAKDEKDVWSKLGGYSMGYGIKKIDDAEKQKIIDDCNEKVAAYKKIITSITSPE